MKKLLNNPKPAIVAIAIIIILFVTYQAKATEVEVSATYAGEFNGGYSLSLIERFGDNVDLGVTLISEQDYKGTVVGNNGVVWFGYVATRPEKWHAALPKEVSIGAAHWIETNRFIGCQQGYMLGLKWQVKKWFVGIRHFSNAGICKPNRGQDLLTFARRF